MQRTLFDEITRTKGDERISARPRRAAIVPVRLTEGERDHLAEVARDLGISLSTYMRQVVLSRPLPARRAVVHRWYTPRRSALHACTTGRLSGWS